MTQELTINQNQEVFSLPDPDKFKHDMEAIKRFQHIAQETMIPEQDYGVIPGTTKPTLLKPGAEKITKVMGLADVYEILDRQEDWNKPFFRYIIKCKLISPKLECVISEGMGECNSMEAKYRFRDAQRKCPSCGAEAIIKGKEQYGGGWLCFKKKGGCGATFKDDDPAIINQEVGKVENEDIFSLVNTILKMAEKRALVDAALHAGRLSNIFTQDIEDIQENTQKKTKIEEPPQDKKPRPQSEKAKSLADCKTVVDVFNYALANGFTTAKLKEVVGTDKPGEVKTDVTGLINFLSSAGLK